MKKIIALGALTLSTLALATPANADDGGLGGAVANPGGAIATAGSSTGTYVCWLAGSTGTSIGSQYFNCSNGSTGIH